MNLILDRYLTIGHVEDWKYPRLKKNRNIAINDIVFLYRTDKKRGIYFIAKVIDIDLDKKNSLDIKIIKDFKSDCFKPEEHSFDNLITKINKLGQNGAIYKFLEEDNPKKLFDYIMNGDIALPEEITNNKDIYEGAQKQITVNIYERDYEARNKCLEHYGYTCTICNFNFEEIYGELGKNFIHVHHLKPLSEIKKMYIVNPINDLRPVCPNCHAMLHRGSYVKSIEEMQNIIINIK